MLLPWYAAGTLDPDETRQVEAALARDPELASRYEWVRAEFAQETAIGDAAGEPSPGDAHTLFAKIDALPARRASPSVGLSARIAEFLTEPFAAHAGLVGGGGSAGHHAAGRPARRLRIPDPEPGRLSDRFGAGDRPERRQLRPYPLSAAGNGRRYRAFLETNKLSIVGGPAGGQLFQVRVAPTKLSQADLARIVNTLQNAKVVGFIAATN